MEKSETTMEELGKEIDSLPCTNLNMENFVNIFTPNDTEVKALNYGFITAILKLRLELFPHIEVTEKALAFWVVWTNCNNPGEAVLYSVYILYRAKQLKYKNIDVKEMATILKGRFDIGMVWNRQKEKDGSNAVDKLSNYKSLIWE